MKYRIWSEICNSYEEEAIVNQSGKVYESEWDEWFVDDEIYSEKTPRLQENKNYTIELSTGLFDKNGKEIY